jgi:hypothetical protein
MREFDMWFRLCALLGCGICTGVSTGDFFTTTAVILALIFLEPYKY